MRVVGIINFDIETLGLFESEILKQGHEIDLIVSGKTPDRINTASQADCVIVLGGPMSANEEGLYPFIKEQYKMISERIQADKPTMGICLGAQIMAKVAGAKVYEGPEQELGWNPVTLIKEGIEDPLFKGCEPGFLTFHWHGDTFDMPPGAVLLAKSDKYAHQAFRLGQKCYGIQFHPEAGDENIKHLIELHERELGNTINNANFMASLTDIASHKNRAKIIIKNFLDVCQK